MHRTTGTYLTSVNTPDYDPGTWVINPDTAPVAGVDTRYWFIDTGDVIREMTVAEKEAAYLPTNKQARKQEVDVRTKQLIAEGFTYSATQFSLSLSAQSNWLGVLTAGAAAGLTYPYPVATLDNAYYAAADAAEMVTLATAALTRKGWAVGTGALLKKSIEDAADQDAVDAIVDSR